MSEPSRLFLITPPVTDAAGFAPLLEAAVGAADVACVRLRTATRDPREAEAIVRALAPIAQRRGAAVLVDLESRLAVRAGADGVHVGGVHVGGIHVDGVHADSDLPELEEALAALRPGRIVGAGAADRDAAMRAGEAGADYVMFGGPEAGFDHEHILDEADWWAAIFNVPCVAYAHHPDLVGELAQTGVEFVALCDGLWDDPGAVAATVRAASLALIRVDEDVR